ncbi:MAG: hypothetical protein J0L93_07705 [Deltaproteobacteria bacterium]|nr:hypothetical protein [Deltaproteobacteria bacterium]
MMKIYSYFLLAVILLTLIFASKFAFSAPKESLYQFTVTLNVDIAAPENDPNPPSLRSTMLKVFLRQKGFTLNNPRSFDPDFTTRYPFTVNSENPSIKNQELTFPFTEETISNIFLRISEPQFFFEKYLHDLPLLEQESECFLDKNAYFAACNLSIPSVQLADKISDNEKSVEIKIFKKSYLPRGNLGFLPLKQQNIKSPSEYLKKFARPNLEDKKSDGKNLTEIDDILFGYFQIEEFTISDPSQNPYRIPLLPGKYRIERIVTKQDGSTEQKFVIVDLEKWGTFKSANELSSQWKNF